MIRRFPLHFPFIIIRGELVVNETIRRLLPAIPLCDARCPIQIEMYVAEKITSGPVRRILPGIVRDTQGRLCGTV